MKAKIADEEWMVGCAEKPQVFVKSGARKSGLDKPLLGELSQPQTAASTFSIIAVVPTALLVGIVIGFTVSCVLLPPRLTKQMTGPVQEQQGPYQLPPPPTEVPAAYYAAAPFNNSNLIPNLATIPAVAGKPQTFDACAFVVKSTDDVWNKRDNVDAAIEKYFHEDYVDAGSWGRRIIGKTELRAAVLGEMRAFPDIRIHITDCLCLGNDVDGYKCAMPDVLTGTNTGPSGYGPATGRQAKWTGMVQSWVKQNPENGQWQYYAEWGVHDEWALVQQLGLDFSRVPHPPINTEPIHDGKALLGYSNGKFSINEDDVDYQKLHDAEKFVGK